MTAANAPLQAFLPFVIACCLSVSSVNRLGAATPGLPRVAYLHAGNLYYFQVKDRWALVRRPPRKPHELWQARLTLEGFFKRGIQFISCLGDAGDQLPDRWRITDGFFWWEEDHESQGGQDHNYEEFWRVPLGRIQAQSEDVWYNCTLEPVLILRDRPAKCAYYDVIPDSNVALHVLVAWRGEIREWRGVYRWYIPDKKKKESWMPKKWPYIKWDNEIPPNEDRPYSDARPVLRVRTDISEGFFAYQDKTHYFFVTISGKLYTCRKSGDKQHTELLWNDANSPIRNIIHDSGSQKTFAFTSAVGGADKHGRHVWFELAPKLKPIDYDPKKVPEWKPSDPLPAMMEYAQIILWNVPPADWRAPSGTATAQQRQQWWQDLASMELGKAHHAVWNLMAGKADTVAFLKERLHPVPATMQDRLDLLLSDLDSDCFERRQAATRELARGVLAESVMRKRLTASPSLELRRRLEAILEDLPEWPAKNPELARDLRAVGLLQQLGTLEGKILLEKIAAGAPSARLTQNAKDALQCLERFKKP